MIKAAVFGIVVAMGALAGCQSECGDGECNDVAGTPVPKDEVATDVGGGVEQHKPQALGFCSPGVDCSTLGAPCTWSATPPSNQVWLGFHLNGDPMAIECRVLAWVQGVNNQQTPIPYLSQYFSDNRLFQVKVGSQTEILMTPDAPFLGHTCTIHGSAAGFVKDTFDPSLGLWHQDAFCSDTFISNGVSSLVVQPTWYN